MCIVPLVSESGCYGLSTVASEKEKCYIFVALISIFLASVRVSLFSCLLAICISCVICLVMRFAHLYNMVFIHCLLIYRNSLYIVDMTLSLFALNTFSEFSV